MVARLWQLFLLGPPIVTADSSMYRYAAQRWLDFPSGNFLGHALRPWPITLLYAVAPTDVSRVLAQFTIATCCWAFCIWQFGRLTPKRPAAAVAAAAVAVFALTTGVAGFDGMLLSESLTLSLVALYVGALLSVCAGRGRAPTLAAAFVAGALLAILRPVFLPLPFGVAVLSGLAGPAARLGGVARRAAVVLLAVLSVAVMGYSWAYNAEIDRTWGDWRGVPGLNGRTLTQYYLAAYHTPYGPALVDALVRAGAPACLRPGGSPPRPGDPAPDPFEKDRLGCPEGQRWLSDHFVIALATSLATHPTFARRYFAGALGDESVVRSEGEGTIWNVVPDSVTNLFFSRRRGFGDPLVTWSVLAVAALVTWSALRPRRPLSPRPVGVDPARALAVTMGVTLAFGYLALVGTGLLSAVDASRVALPATALIRLVLIVVLVRTTAATIPLLRQGRTQAAR